jgi:hypothetical protein
MTMLTGGGSIVPSRASLRGPAVVGSRSAAIRSGDITDMSARMYSSGSSNQIILRVFLVDKGVTPMFY